MKLKSFYRTFTRLVLVILGIASIIGCIPKPTPTQAFVYPTSITSCLPDSVFTAEEMQARVDCQPDDYKIEINKDTVISFAFSDPVMDWVGPVFITHIPSVSETVLNTDGSIRYESYNSLEGEKAIKDVLNNPELMDEIIKRAKEIGLFN